MRAPAAVSARAAAFALLLAVATVQAHPGADLRLDVLDRLIAQKPGAQDLHIRRAALLSHEGDFDAAQAELERSRRLGDPGAIDFELGVLEFRRGRFAEAQVALDRWLVRTPRDPDALLYRARANSELGQTARALTDYQAHFALAAAPNPGDWLAAARLLEHEDPQRSLELLEAGLQRLGPVASLQELAVAIERRTGRLDRALVRWEALGEVLRHGPAWQVGRADLLLANGRAAEGLQVLANAEQQLDALRPTPAREALRARITSLRGDAGAVPQVRPAAERCHGEPACA